eukprot:1888470-Pyramimonas_sp.AAC.1
MATRTTVDPILKAATPLTMAVMTAARSMTGPMLITPADDNDDVLASATKAFEGVRHARAVIRGGLVGRARMPRV